MFIKNKFCCNLYFKYINSYEKLKKQSKNAYKMYNAFNQDLVKFI